MILSSILTFLFIYLVPISLGTLFFPYNKFGYSISWIYGLLITGIFIVLLHAFGFSKAFTILSIVILALFGLYLILRDLIKVQNKKIVLKNYLPFIFIIIPVSVISIEQIFSVILNPLTAGDSLAYYWSKTKALLYWEPIMLFKTQGYPHLGSAIWFMTINFLGEQEFIGRIFFILIQTVIYLTFCLVFLDNKNINFFNKFIFGSIIVIFFYFLLNFEMGGGYKFTSSGYMDWLVALLPAFSYFLIISKNKLNVIDSKGNIQNTFFVLVFIAAASLIVKAEGYIDFLIYSVTSIVIFYLFQKNTFNKRNLKYLFFTVIIFIIFKNLNSFIYFINQIYIEDVQDFNVVLVFTAYFDNLSRLPVILDYFQNVITDSPLISASYIFLFIYMFKLNKIKLLMVSLIPIIIYHAFILTVYLSTPFDFEWHLSTSMNRLYYHIVIMMLFSNIIFISEILKDN